MPKGKRVHQASAGIDIREHTRCRRGDAAQEPDYAGYGFADVRRACHRWLMKHDEQYRRNYDARQAGLASPTTTHRGF